MAYQGFFLVDENALEWGGCTALWVYSKPLNCISLNGWNVLVSELYLKKHQSEQGDAYRKG